MKGCEMNTLLNFVHVGTYLSFKSFIIRFSAKMWWIILLTLSANFLTRFEPTDLSGISVVIISVSISNEQKSKTT